MIFNVLTLTEQCIISSYKESNSAQGVCWTQPFWGHLASGEWQTRSPLLCVGGAAVTELFVELNNFYSFTSYSLVALHDEYSEHNIACKFLILKS